MDVDKNMILKLFKAGGTIGGVTGTIFYQMKDDEFKKPKKERAKIDRKEVKRIVEQTVLNDYLLRVSNSN